MSNSIYEATLTCRENLGAYWATRKKDTWLQQCIINFSVWASESGAALRGRRGLDERLCTRESHRSCIVGLLNAMNGHVRLASSQMDLSRNYDINMTAADRKHGRAISKSADQGRLRNSIDTALREIINLTASVVRSLPSAGLWEADHCLLTGDLGHLKAELDTFRFEMNVLVRNSTTGGLGDSNSLAPKVWKRIVDANVRRRKRFLYARQKRGKILHRDVTAMTFQWPQEPGLHIPFPPVIKDESRTFDCPSCFERLPTYFTEPAAWRKHLLTDLEPYCCVFTDCNEGHLTYSSTVAWTKHMLSHVPPRVKGKEPTDSKLPMDRTKVILESDVLSNALSRLECPFCPGLRHDEASIFDSLLEHISTCLLSFAMAAIPPETIGAPPNRFPWISRQDMDQLSWVANPKTRRPDAKLQASQGRLKLTIPQIIPEAPSDPKIATAIPTIRTLSDPILHSDGEEDAPTTGLSVPQPGLPSPSNGLLSPAAAVRKGRHRQRSSSQPPGDADGSSPSISSVSVQVPSLKRYAESHPAPPRRHCPASFGHAKVNSHIHGGVFGGSFSLANIPAEYRGKLDGAKRKREYEQEAQLKIWEYEAATDEARRKYKKRTGRISSFPIRTGQDNVVEDASVLAGMDQFA